MTASRSMSPLASFVIESAFDRSGRPFLGPKARAGCAENRVGPSPETRTGETANAVSTVYLHHRRTLRGGAQLLQERPWGRCQGHLALERRARRYGHARRHGQPRYALD